MKSLKLPALRAVVTDTAHKERRVFPLLFVVASSISLISAPKGENSLIPLLLLSPPNPLALGFGGGPIWSSAEPRKRPNSPSNPPQVGQGLPQPCNRPHSPSQGGTWGFLRVSSQVLLHLLPLLLFLQLVHLLLVVAVQRYLDWEDGVLVVAVPFHAVAVQVAGVFHSDELFLLQFCDVFHDSGYREMYRRGNGSVAGMTLVGASIFTVEQIGVDGDGSVTEMQKEQFVGQREEILPGVPAH